MLSGYVVGREEAQVQVQHPNEPESHCEMIEVILV
jgi:hypothetical protein